MRNCLFKNWTHSALKLFPSDEQVKGVHIHHNEFTSPNVAYGRAIDVGILLTDADISYNYIHDMYTRSQISGIRTHFHHNAIENIHKSPISDKVNGQAFILQPLSGSADGCVIEYNRADNTDCEAFIVVSNESGHYVKNCKIENNIFYNVSLNNYPYKKNRMVRIYNDPNMKNNSYSYNKFYSSQLEVSPPRTYQYREQIKYTPEDFNKVNTTDGDIITGNAWEKIEETMIDFRTKYGIGIDGENFK